MLEILEIRHAANINSPTSDFDPKDKFYSNASKIVNPPSPPC